MAKNYFNICICCTFIFLSFFSTCHSLFEPQEVSKNALYDDIINDSDQKRNFKKFSEINANSFGTLLTKENDKTVGLSVMNSSLLISKVSLKIGNSKFMEAFKESNTVLKQITIISSDAYFSNIIWTDSSLVMDSITFAFPLESTHQIGSLIRSPGKSNVCILNLNMKDVTHTGESTVILSGDAEEMMLDSCKFVNITWNTRRSLIESRDVNDEGCKYTSVKTIRSKIIGCESPFYGSITTTRGVLSLLTENSSFVSCFEEKDNSPERQELTDKDYSFKNDEFSNYISQGVHGGTFYISGHSVTFESCEFFKCRTESKDGVEFTLGGAIYATETGFICKYANFTQCFANGGDHFISIHSAVSLSIVGCLFDTGDGNWFGGVGINNPPSDSVMNLCSLDNVTSRNQGGSLTLRELNENEFIVTDCSFENNFAVFEGAGVYFYNLSDNVTPKFLFTFCRFYNNSVCTHGCDEGQNLDLSCNDRMDDDICFYIHYNGKNYHSQDNFVDCVTDSTEKTVFQCTRMDGEKCPERVSYDYLIHYTYSDLYVNGVNGEDIKGCGRNDAETKCKTVKYALESLLPGFNGSIFIESEGAKQDSRLNVVSLTVTINAADENIGKEERPHLRLKGEGITEGLITVKKGHLNLTNLFIDLSGEVNDQTNECEMCKMNHPSGELEFVNCTVSGSSAANAANSENGRVSVLHIAQGSVTLKNTEFINFVLSNNPLINIDYHYNSEGSDPMFSIESVLFTNIERLKGNGGIFDLDLKGRTIYLNNFNCTNCTCSKGYGGAIYASVDKNSKIYIGDKDKFTVFKKCASKAGNPARGGAFYLYLNEGCTDGFLLENIEFVENTATNGSNLFIYCDVLETVASQEKFKITIPLNIPENSKLLMGRDKAGPDDENLLDVWGILPEDKIYDEVYVGPDGKDEYDCGPIDKKCLSLNKGLHHLDQSSTSMNVDGGVVKDQIKMEREEFTFQPSVEGTKATVKTTVIDTSMKRAVNGEGGLLQCSKIMTIKSLIFVCQNYFLFDSLITQNGGSLTLTGCELNKNENEAELSENQIVRFTFITLNGGEFVATDLTIKEVTFENAGIIIGGSSETPSLTTVNVQNVGCLSGLFEINIVGENNYVSFDGLTVDGVDLNGDSFFKYPGITADRVNDGPSKLILNNSHLSNILRSGTEAAILSFAFESNRPLIEWAETEFANCKPKEDSNSGSIIDIGTSSALFTSCTFKGEEAIEETPVEENVLDICTWTGSIVEVNGGNANFVSNTIANSSKGGININGGSVVTLDGSKFEGNNPKFTNFGSVRRNVLCEKSTLNGENLIEEKTDALWISGKECTYNDAYKPFSSILFIPTIEDIYYNRDDENRQLIITLKGNLLLPCNVSYILKNIVIDGAEVTQEDFKPQTENEATIIIPYDRFDVESLDFFEITIVYPDGKGGTSEKSVKVYKEGDPRAHQNQTKITGKWWFWLIIAIAALILLIIIIIIICCCCCRRKKSNKKEQEMAEEEKVESGFERNALYNNDTSAEYAYNPYADNRETHVYTGRAGLGRLLDAFSCAEPYDKVSVDMNQALYFQISSSQSSSYNLRSNNLKEREVNAARICYQLVNGMIHFMSRSEGRKIAVHLSPQTIVLGERGYVYVVMLRDASQEELSRLGEAETAKLNQLQQSQRWSAPEVLKRDQLARTQSVAGGYGGRNQAEIEKAVEEKSVVFTIGMLLYELITLSDPFSESDAVTAGAKIIKGDRPKLDTLRHDHRKFCSIVSKCWSAEIEDRPSLSALQRKLMGLLPEYQNQMGGADDDSDSD